MRLKIEPLYVIQYTVISEFCDKFITEIRNLFYVKILCSWFDCNIKKDKYKVKGYKLAVLDINSYYANKNDYSTYKSDHKS